MKTGSSKSPFFRRKFWKSFSFSPSVFARVLPMWSKTGKTSLEYRKNLNKLLVSLKYLHLLSPWEKLQKFNKHSLKRRHLFEKFDVTWKCFLVIWKLFSVIWCCLVLFGIILIFFLLYFYKKNNAKVTL